MTARRRMAPMTAAAVLLATLVATAAAATQASASAQAGVLTESDSGHYIIIDVGERFNLSLGSASSTGYAWRVVGLDRGVAGVVATDDVSPAVPGGGTWSNWTFEGRRDGETTLRLEYYREWQGSDSSIDSFNVHIVVGKGNVAANASFLAAMVTVSLAVTFLAHRRRLAQKAPRAPAARAAPKTPVPLLDTRTAGAMGLAGILSILAGLAGSLALYPRFSPWDGNVSDLGVSAGSTFFNWGLVACGVLGMFFSLGLASGLARGRPLRLAGAALLGGGMAALAGIGILTEVFGPLHFYVAVAFFALYIPAALVLGLSLSRDGAFRNVGRLAVLAAALGLVAWLLPSGEGIAIPELVASLPGPVWLGLLSFSMARSKTI